MWNYGKVKGIRTKGGLLLDICWKDEKVSVAVHNGNNTDYRIYSEKLSVRLFKK